MTAVCVRWQSARKVSTDKVVRSAVLVPTTQLVTHTAASVAVPRDGLAQTAINVRTVSMSPDCSQ